MKKRYKRLTYIFPNAIEVYEYLDGRYGARGSPRKKKDKPTKEQIRKRNQWNKERKARHKLRKWFKENDYLVTFTWRKADRPDNMREAVKILGKALRKIRAEYRKRGYELRYLRNIEVGTRGAWHIHMVVNRIQDADLILKKAWNHGGVNFKLLYDVWHMNDMGRDIMSDIKKYHSYISHYHIAGIPERKGLNRTDSFNYQQLMKLLKKVGYQGYVGLEPDRIEKNLKSTIQESITLLKNK